jgi:hypothetical protein
MLFDRPLAQVERLVGLRLTQKHDDLVFARGEFVERFVAGVFQGGAHGHLGGTRLLGFRRER